MPIHILIVINVSTKIFQVFVHGEILQMSVNIPQDQKKKDQQDYFEE